VIAENAAEPGAGRLSEAARSAARSAKPREEAGAEVRPSSTAVTAR